MIRKGKSAPSGDPKEKGNRYLIVNWRRYWIRNILISVGLFAIIAWLRYPTQGATAFLWAFGVAGIVLAYFAVNYYYLRK